MNRSAGGGRKSKLAAFIDGFLYAAGGGSGCPILVFGISKALYDEDC